MTNQLRIGMIGLGIMGGAMAERLLQAGYAVYGYDISRQAISRFKKQGGIACNQVEDLLPQVDIVITSLPTTQAMDKVTQAIYRTVANQRNSLKILIETSTLPLINKMECAKQLKLVGITALDCPIMGTVAQLKDRLWSFFASGPKKTYKQALPILKVFTDNVVYVGTYGSGTKMKLVANHLVAIYNVAYAESVTLARKMGLNPYDVLTLFGTSPILGTGVMRSRMAMMVERRYTPPTMKVQVWQKDMAVIGEMAKAIDCPTPLFNASADLYTAAMAQGLALEDTASTAEVLGAMAGLAPRKKHHA